MIEYSQIREVHLELSSNCNAACPFCPRNVGGYSYNAGYPVTTLSLENIQKIFKPDFLSQLFTIIINGNYGDFVTVKDALDTVSYLRKHTQANIIINTNGSARTVNFWTKLAQFNPIVIFGIDGLEDTHHLHRRQTNFNLILRNARAYITAGGNAVWKMIEFDHNRHQVDDCQQLAQDMGFSGFELITNGRHNGVVFDQDGNYDYTIGQVQYKAQSSAQALEWVNVNFVNKHHYNDPVKNTISCETINKKSIYISSNGEVYPCCYLGFYPRTYDPSLVQGNDQIKELLNGVENNVLVKPLEDCISWFNLVEQSWTKETFQEGRLWRCNHHCGH